MLIENLRPALKLFPKGCRVTLDYIPECYEFSSAPKNPSRLYMQVDELPHLMDEGTELALVAMGWHNVDNLGYEWVLHI